MAQLMGLLLFLILNLAQAKGLQLDLYAQTALPQKLKFEKEDVGGLSGISFENGKLLAISDDRGKFGPPRFYELDLKITSGKAEMSVTKVHHFKDMPKDWVLDLEAIVRLPNGDLIASTEGDNNHKLRAMPHIFVTSNTGVYKSDLALPDKFLPEATGLQKKGIENNRGFEGVTLAPNGELYIMNESPIVADQGDSDNEYWVRLVEFKKDKDAFKAAVEYPYLVTRSANSDLGVEVMRGISEILAWSDHQFVVLERGARLTKKGIAYSGGLYLADTSGAKDVSAVKNLSEGKTAAMKKTKLVDFEELIKNEKIENFEGLAWGPALPDGRKSLLVISDNNFSSKEKTALLVFAVKEVE